MPGMEIPQPGGTMKKMQFEFTDPAAQQASQIPQGAGVPPAGAEEAIPPAGMQAPAQPAMPPPQDPMAGGMQGTMFDQFGQPGMEDTSIFSDEDLAQLVQEDPAELQGQQMDEMAMQDPQIQMQLMEAARRRMGAF